MFSILHYSKLGVFTCLILSVSACSSILSGTGPYSSSITNGANSQNSKLPYQLVDLSPDNFMQYGRQPVPPALANVSTGVVQSIRIAPGDYIKVMIADGGDGGVFAPLAAGGNTFNKVRVNARGTINLPYVGTIKVAGQSPEAIETHIRKRLKGDVAIDPQVHVEMEGDLSNSVLVAGAVKKPGRFSSTQGPLTILDAVNMAGGPLLEPHLINVTVRNGKESYTVNYEDILEGRNKSVAPRSEIILDRARQRFVAMGAVTRPGLTDLPSRESSLLEVLGSVGGLSEAKADPQGVFIFRFEPNSSNVISYDRKSPGADAQGRITPTVFRLDMRKPESMFIAKSFRILPDDTIYVTNAPIYEWQKIISPIASTMYTLRYTTGTVRDIEAF